MAFPIAARTRGSRYRLNKGALISIFPLLALLLGACQTSPATLSGSSLENEQVLPNVLAVESFLADIAKNVAGERLPIDTLLPLGIDPHGFEPSARDLASVADSDILIVNGSGFESFLEGLVGNIGGDLLVVEASAGLDFREPGDQGEGDLHDDEHEEGDPHFWLDPLLAITYVENIRDGLSQADPTGANEYNLNAQAYIAKLKELDLWIVEQIQQIPAERRLLVTNHESFGYFADRYGFLIVGTVIPSSSTGAAPSANELAELVTKIRESGVKAIFLETGSNPRLAQQIAQETGIRVVDDLYTHSTSQTDGPASTYIEMMKYNTLAIVESLR